MSKLTSMTSCRPLSRPATALALSFSVYMHVLNRPQVWNSRPQLSSTDEGATIKMGNRLHILHEGCESPKPPSICCYMSGRDCELLKSRGRIFVEVLL